MAEIGYFQRLYRDNRFDTSDTPYTSVADFCVQKKLIEKMEGL